MTGMSQTNCCCGEGNPCSDCNADVQICCVKATHPMWSMNPILLNSELRYDYFSGDECPIDVVSTASNLCGTVATMWSDGCPWQDCGEPFRPMWDTTTHACMPTLRLMWGVSPDCETVGFRLEWSYPSRDYTESTTLLTKLVAVATADRDWYLSSVSIPDPVYTYNHTIDPVEWPLPIPDFTFEVCPTSFIEFPEPDEPVYLKARRQRSTDAGATWNYVSVGALELLTVYNRGNCVCSMDNGCKNGTGGSGYRSLFRWRYIPYTDSIRLSIRTPEGGSGDYYVDVDYDDCNWPDSTIYLNWINVEAGEYERWEIVRVESCDETGTHNPPPKPERYCRAPKLCVMLTVMDGEYHSYYTLLWNGTDEQYYMAPQAVPGPSGCTIEITLKEDTSLLPEGSPPGSRAWLLTVVIKDSEDAVVLEYTEVYVLDCTKEWTRTSDLTVPFDPEETWELKVSTSCPDPPDPPTECDPGCWPECVMCPTRKTLYAVVSDNPDCCLSGAYALTWVGTGGEGSPTVGYFELPATVGGPIGTCGQITFLRVSCVDASHIMVQLVYLRAEGTEISNLSSPDTLAVTCDESGNLESEPIHVPGRSGDRESLCGFGSGVGGDIRIVSI